MENQESLFKSPYSTVNPNRIEDKNKKKQKKMSVSDAGCEIHSFSMTLLKAMPPKKTIKID